MMYKMLLGSSFAQDCDVIFLDMKSRPKYWVRYIFLMITRRPRYVLFDMNFDKVTFWEDYLFCLTGKLLGRRIVLHDMGQYLPELYASGGPLLRSLIGHLLRMTYAMIVIGEKVRRAYAPFFDLQRIKVVPGSVEDTADIPVAVSSKEGALEVLYFSLLSVSKGLWTALKAIPLVVHENPRIHFTFGGPIESQQLHEQMQDFIKAQGLQPYVSYVGYVADTAQRSTYYRNADIFIFPTHRDSFGLVILHAMAEGIPVVASMEGTIPEIIEDGINGFLFKKGNVDQLARKILDLAGDAHLRQQMGAANRRRYVSHYSPQVCGRGMTEAFEQIEQS